jgi:hypothetical protein
VIRGDLKIVNQHKFMTNVIIACLVHLEVQGEDTVPARGAVHGHAAAEGLGDVFDEKRSLQKWALWL